MTLREKQFSARNAKLCHLQQRLKRKYSAANARCFNQKRATLRTRALIRKHRQEMKALKRKSIRALALSLIHKLGEEDVRYSKLDISALRIVTFKADELIKVHDRSLIMRRTQKPDTLRSRADSDVRKVKALITNLCEKYEFSKVFRDLCDQVPNMEFE